MVVHVYICINACIGATVGYFYVFDGVMCLIKNVSSRNRKRLIKDIVNFEHVEQIERGAVN